MGGTKVLNFMGTGDGGASVVGVTEFSYVSLLRNQQKTSVCAHTCVCLGKIFNSVEKRPHKHPTNYT